MSEERTLSIVARVALLGVVLITLASLAAINLFSPFGRIFPIPMPTVGVLIAFFEGSERSLMLFGLGLLPVFTTAIALAPTILRPFLAQRLVLPLLLFAAIASLYAWIQNWGAYQEYGTKRILVYAFGNCFLATHCFYQYRAWRRDPEGPADLRLPLSIQFWLQTSWILFPYDD